MRFLRVYALKLQSGAYAAFSVWGGGGGGGGGGGCTLSLSGPHVSSP